MIEQFPSAAVRRLAKHLALATLAFSTLDGSEQDPCSSTRWMTIGLGDCHWSLATGHIEDQQNP
jgi:hypothetical protein